MIRVIGRQRYSSRVCYTEQTKALAAQSGTGVIAGAVTDATGRPPGGVLVLLDGARGGGGDDPSFEFYRPWGMAGFRIER